MIVRIFIFISVLYLTGCKKNDPATVIDLPGIYLKQTVQYKSILNVSSNLLSLDIYNYQNTASLKPVVIYVHGGGWAIGDKSNSLENKKTLFNSLNYIFISVNYRLSPFPYELSNSQRIRYPDHNNDVADAVKWVADSISKYGGNPLKMVLMGHSAGAHLVSLTGTSQLFLPLRNIPVGYIKGIAAIDTEGYDVPSQISETLYQNAFGSDNNLLIEASPIYNVSAAFTYPRFFIAKRGGPARIAYADAFINKLTLNAVSVSQINGSVYDHEGINNAIGDEDDTVITPALKTFLEQCFQ